MSYQLITIRQAVIGYTGKAVLANVNMLINKGRHWALVGESGSGKTTLLQTLAGSLQIKSGHIIHHFAQGDNGINHDYRSLIAFVATKHHFRTLSNTSDFYYQQRYNSADSDDALTVCDYLKNIATGSTTNHQWDYGRTLDLLKLAPLADKQLIKLSNGETKRLMIAAALLKNPLLLLLDNPLAGLDTQTRAEFNHIVEEIASSGITIIMATGTNEIPSAFSHVAVLKNGAVSTFPKDNFNANHAQPALVEPTGFKLDGLLDKYPAPAYRHIVDMQNVMIKYGDKIILNHINWQIAQGQRWALIGPNGAGKSTLLSLINGDNPQAYANDITLFDRKRGTGESIWDIKKKTGFISPELYQFFPPDTVCLQAIESGYYDTMGLFRPSDQQRANRALQWMKVLAIDQYARQLLRNIPASAQRLCLLARAMIKNPVLLILDEPCQGLDSHQVQHFTALVDTICRQTNITLIYVTHYAHHIPESVGMTLRLEGGCVLVKCVV
jgi:molybdate transport system ATP-binding protein